MLSHDAALVVAVAAAVAALLPAEADGRAAGPALLPGWAVDRWTVDDGLPLDHVADIAETPDGFLWLGTFDGLARFDGSQFRVFRRAEFPTLPTNRLYRVVARPDGTLWVAGEPGHLVRYARRGVFEAWTLPRRGSATPILGLFEAHGSVFAIQDQLFAVGDGPPRPVAPIEGLGLYRSLAADTEGSLWVSAHEDGLFRLDPDGRRTDVGLAGWDVAAPHGVPFVTRDGTVWLTTGAGLARVAADRLLRVPGPERAAGEPFCEVIDGPDGRPLARSASGWLAIDEVGRMRPAARAGPPGRVRCDRARSVVAGGVVFEHAGDAVLRDGAPLVRGVEEVRRLFADSRGHVWAATVGHGLLRFRPLPVQSVGPAEGLPAASVESLIADRAGRVIATQGWNGVSVAGPDGVSGVALPAPVHEHGTGAVYPCPAFVDHDGSVLVPTTFGVCRVEGERCVPHPVLWRTEWSCGPGFTDPGGRVWLATTANGLVLLTPSAEGFAPTRPAGGGSLGSEVVRAIVGDPAGGVLVATADRGLVRFAGGPDGGAATELGPAGRAVRHVMVDRHGVAWLGTDDSGLCRVGPERIAGSADCRDRRHGLPDDAVHAIATDGRGRVWLSTNHGLVVVEATALDALFAGASDHVPALTLDERDGMPDREGNGYRQPAVARDPLSRLWFATQGGIAIVRPDAFDAPPPPPVNLEEVSIGGRPVDRATLAGGVSLDPGARDIVVAWSAPALEHPDDVRFRHRVVGLDDAWSAPNTSLRAEWTALPPGDFTIEVQAGLLLWGPTTRLAVRRAPAFRETPYFPAALVLAGVAITLAAVRLRARALYRRKAELERLIAARTAELAEQAATLEERNRRIASQAARLEELRALRDRFVANVSHELRTPMTLITGPLSDLAANAEALPADAAKRLDVIRRNADRLEELLGQLLDFARLDEGGLRLRARRRDLAAFLRAASERFGDAASRAGIALDVAVDGGPVAVYFDADLLDKVVSNLLGNALKFTPPGGWIRLSLDPAPAGAAEALAEGTFACVRIEDTGPGIPAGELERVFERFHQVDGGPTRRQGGAGIGLSLARELVALHGGDMGVESAPGEGARFWFTLPRGAAHLAPEEIDTGGGLADGPGPSGWPGPASLPRDRDAAGDSAGGRPVVLVVEDNDDMRSYLAEGLSALGVVVEAPDGGAALALARRARPDVIVSDVMMPEMDGISLCRAVRADPGMRDVPLVLVTAKTSAADRVEGLSIADEFVAKPFRMPELVARVRNLLRRAGPAGSGPPPASRTAPASPAGAGRSVPAPEPTAAPPGMPEHDRQFLDRLRAVVVAHLADEGFSVPRLARSMALSPRQFQRRCRDLTGQGPVEYVRGVRMEEARALVRRGAYRTVAEVAAAVGMSAAYFARLYSAWHGHPPSEDLRG